MQPDLVRKADQPGSPAFSLFSSAGHFLSRRRLFVLLFFSLGFLTGFGQPTQVAIITQPVQGAVNGGLMAVQPVVEIRDAGNQKVTGSTAQVEIVIATGSGGTLGGTTRINAVNGTATFTDLTFSGIDGNTYTFQFKSTPLIAYEPFAYGAGTLPGNNGGSGWSGAWLGANPAFTDLSVNTSGLTYPNFSTSGGYAYYVNSTGGDAERFLADTSSNNNNKVVWLAFLANYDQQGGGFNNVRLYLPSGLSGAVGGNGGVYNWSILNTSLNANSSTSIPLDGTLRLALMKIDYTAGTSALWIDPSVNSFDGTQTPAMTETFAPVFNRISLYNRYTDRGTDEITLASTYKAALHLEQNLTSAFSTSITLPVTWTYFTATCKDSRTLLNWGTSSENNNSHFTVEKSLDGLGWSAIGELPGKGNSGVDQDYSFLDSSSLYSKMFYRIRQTDIDGHLHYSRTIAASCRTGNNQPLRVFPNPVTNTLQVSGARPGARYQLMDARGQMVRTGIIMNGTTPLSMSDLPEGNYFLHVPEYKSVPVQVMKTSR